MEEKQKSVISSALVFGLITGAAGIVFHLVTYLSNLYLNQYVSWLGYLVVAAGMVYGTLDYRKKQSGGFLTYGKAFSSCFWIGLFAGIVSTFYFFIFINYLHPGMVNEILEQARVKMLEQNSMSEDQVEQALAMQQKFMSPLMMTLWGFFAYAIVSAILGLILGIFLKKNDPDTLAE